MRRGCISKAHNSSTRFPYLQKAACARFFYQSRRFEKARKRAGLARALVLEPKILLAVEPSSGLDRITAAEIDELLIRQKAEHQTTLENAAHFPLSQNFGHVKVAAQLCGHQWRSYTRTSSSDRYLKSLRLYRSHLL